VNCGAVMVKMYTGMTIIENSMEGPQKTKNRPGDMAQMVECLSSKHNTLSSNISNTFSTKKTK
jgi:hypothetical protein